MTNSRQATIKPEPPMTELPASKDVPRARNSLRVTGFRNCPLNDPIGPAHAQGIFYCLGSGHPCTAPRVLWETRPEVGPLHLVSVKRRGRLNCRSNRWGRLAPRPAAIGLQPALLDPTNPS